MSDQASAVELKDRAADCLTDGRFCLTINTNIT